MYRVIFYCFYFNQLMHKYIYHNSISLYNVHCYMFRCLYVILSEFYICASLSFINLMFVCPCIISINVNDDQQDATILV